jgi:hypothetical protein
MVAALPFAVLTGCRFGFGQSAHEVMRDDSQADGGAHGADAAMGPSSGESSDGLDDAGTQENPADSGEGPAGDAGESDAGAQQSHQPGDAGSETADAGAAPPDPVTELVRFTGRAATPERGGTGGSAFSDDCPSSSALVGFQGYVSSDPAKTWLMRIQGLCAKVTVTDGVLAFAKPVALAQHGADGDITWQRQCPKGLVLVGFTGRTGDYLDQLVLSCAPLTVSGSPGNYSFALGATQTLAPVGGDGGAAFAAANCANGQLAFGDSGRSGQWVDALSLTCGTVQIAP